jgi:hypothetical protein
MRAIALMTLAALVGLCIVCVAAFWSVGGGKQAGGVFDEPAPPRTAPAAPPVENGWGHPTPSASPRQPAPPPPGR